MEKGSLTLETAIFTPIFFFLFMCIYGLFVIFTAQNEITHTLLQSANSMAMDAYITEAYKSIDKKANYDDYSYYSLMDLMKDIFRHTEYEDSKGFVDTTNWYVEIHTTPPVKSVDGEETPEVEPYVYKSEVAKARFIAYLSGGDEEKAGERLEALRVVDGLDGMTFDLQVNENDETFTVTVYYNLQYWFDFAGLGKIPMHQSVKSRLWK